MIPIQTLERTWRMTELLREFIILELQLDRRFIAMLKNTGPMSQVFDTDAVKIADEWISDFEFELGKRISHGIKSRVRRYVNRRWRGMLTRFHDNHSTARQTIMNLLDAKFASTTV